MITEQPMLRFLNSARNFRSSGQRSYDMGLTFSHGTVVCVCACASLDERD